MPFSGITSRLEVAHFITPGRYCVIDIGTVTCRMLVADVAVCGAGARAGVERTGAGAAISVCDYSDVSIIPVAKEYKIVNLGEGVDATGMLCDAAIARLRAALVDYLAILNKCDTAENPVVKTVCFATSASRDAKNADDFANMMRELGLDVRIIAGAREAALSYLGAGLSLSAARAAAGAGVRAGAGVAGDNLVAVVDVGGGSTEISIGYVGSPPIFSHSFDIGCRRVTERFFADDPPTDEQFNRAGRWISSELKSVFGDICAARNRQSEKITTGSAAACPPIDAHAYRNDLPLSLQSERGAGDFSSAGASSSTYDLDDVCDMDISADQINACTHTFPTFPTFPDFAIDCLPLKMIAVAGSATSVVTVRDGIGVYDSELVNGARVSRDDLQAVTLRLMRAAPDERGRIVGLDPGRSPVIVAGMLILGCVMDTLGTCEFIASDNDILEGAALSVAGW